MNQIISSKIYIHKIFQIDAVFKSSDTNQDGKLSREEFNEFMNRPKKSSSKINQMNEQKTVYHEQFLLL